MIESTIKMTPLFPLLYTGLITPIKARNAISQLKQVHIEHNITANIAMNESVCSGLPPALLCIILPVTFI